MADNGQCIQCGEALEDFFNFCPECGRSVTQEGEMTEREIIEMYFYCGFTYSCILQLMSKYHNINMSLSTLKRRLQSFNLARSRDAIDVDQIREAIRKEMDGPGCLFGYRSMWHSLRMGHGLTAPRERVQRLMKEIDPDGCELRKRRRLRRRSYWSLGPNHTWHIDGYDKLKDFGFPIHGCVDGFSRKVLWLNVSRSNNDPSVVLRFYLDCVDENEGCPLIVQSDCGTENGNIAAAQCYFRVDATDEYAGEKAHRYGESKRNQRIEAWWSCFKKSRSPWWINLFKDLMDSGQFEYGNVIHKECMWFCFSDIIQEDLNYTRALWNNHYIRSSRYETVPGRPDELYYLPERHDSEDQKQPVNAEKLNEVRQHVTDPVNQDNQDVQEYLNYVCTSEGLEKPTDWRSALNLYTILKQIAEQV